MKPTLYLAVAISCFLFVSAYERAESKTVITSEGHVKGYKAEDADVFVFYGIPYATMPKGKDKFKAPLPLLKRKESLEAIDYAVACPQNEDMLKAMNLNLNITEDCLVANIYLPNTEKKKLPVVVQVHGGAYQIGFGNLLTPIAIVENAEIIFVNFNYRLGAHGFLCLGTETAPGNAGLKDMVALLRWIQGNIANFGGNPDDVTITGYSAGSSAVHHLMLSESVQGLFHKVIMESGTANAVFGMQRDPLKNAKDLAMRFNENPDDVTGLEEFYENAPFEKLTSDVCLSNRDSTICFVPCVENELGQVQVIKESPVDVMKKRQYTKVPLLIGHAHLEGLWRKQLFDFSKADMNQNFSEFLPGDLHFDSASEKAQVALTVKQFYFGDEDVCEKTAKAYVHYFGDITYVYPDVVAARLHVENGNKVYLYDYNYFDSSSVNVNLVSNLTFPVEGPEHCSQTYALYSLPPLLTSQESDNFKKVKAQIRQLWVDFIKNGRPTIQEELWPPALADSSPYMEIGLTNVLKKEKMIGERVALWDSIYKKYYKHPMTPSDRPSKRENVEL